MGSRFQLFIMEETRKLQKALLFCKIVGGLLACIHFMLIVSTLGNGELQKEKIIFMPEQIFKIKTLQVFVFGYTPGQVYINGIMMIFWTSLFWLDLATILGVY